jgi:hypothetical protein
MSSVARTASALAALVVTTAAAVPASAQPTHHGTSVQGRVILDGTYVCDIVKTGVLDELCELGNDEGRVRAYVDASMRLHADASVYDSFRPQSGHVAFARAYYHDRLTFTGDVIPASVRLTMYLHGGAAGQHSYGELSFYHQSSEPTYTIRQPGTGPGDPNNHIVSRLPTPTLGVVRGSRVVAVTDGRVDFSLALSAFVRMDPPETGNTAVYCTIFQECAGIGVRANFFETAALELITALDADGNEIHGGVQIQSASGFNYAVAGAIAPTTTTTPEPASLALVGTGLLGVGVAGARRRRGVLRS